MELHEHIRNLVNELDAEILHDADSFRGALDDYLDEGTATTGEVNVLVDTVRLGAFQRFDRLVSSGAHPPAAVAEAGEHLARDRGTTDVAGSRWACAVLAYAAGQVDATEVQRYRTANLPPSESGPALGPAPGSPVVSPWTGPAPTAAGPSMPRPPGWEPDPTAAAPTAGPAGNSPASSWPQVSQRAVASPTSAAGHPQPAHGHYQPSPGYPKAPHQQQPPPGWRPAGQGHGASSPPGGSRRWPLVLLALVVALALVGGGVWWSLRDDDAATRTASSGDATSSDGTETTDVGPTDNPSGPTDDPPPTDPEAVAERYSALGSTVASDASTCRELDLQPGDQERLTCAYPNAMLELVDYESTQQLKQARTRITGYGVGAMYSAQDDGVFYMHVDAQQGSQVYWDSTARQQSGMFICPECTTPAELGELFSTVDPTIKVPTSVEDAGLEELMAGVVDFDNCTRIVNNAAGTTERHICRQEGFRFYFARFLDRAGFLGRRAHFRTNAVKAAGYRDTWDVSGPQGDKNVGAIYAFVALGDGLAHIYWDDPNCNCYGIIIGNDDRLQPLWTRGWNCTENCPT